RVLIALSDAAGRYGVIAVLALAALIASIALALHHPARKRQWHALALQLPGYAEFVRTREAARFVSTLAILGRSGVVLVEAMSIGAG
ncbi:hypothetical protein R0K19_24950, partial [Bacillus sp. SIMBA_161]